MRIAIIIILLLSSCHTIRVTTKESVSGSKDNPILICDDDDVRALSIECVGDHITGADAGGTYQIGYQPNGSNVNLDPNTGCFDDEEMICEGEDGLYEFWYIVQSPDCENCYDTTSVYYVKCCLVNNPTCNE